MVIKKDQSLLETLFKQFDLFELSKHYSNGQLANNLGFVTSLITSLLMSNKLISKTTKIKKSIKALETGYPITIVEDPKTGKRKIVIDESIDDPFLKQVIETILKEVK